MQKMESKKSTLVVSVSDKNLTAAEFKRSGHKISLLAQSQTDLTPGIIENGMMQKPAAFQSALKNLLLSPDQGGFRSGRATLLLPEQLFTYHIAHIGNGENLASAAAMQARLRSALFQDQDQWHINSTIDTVHEKYRFGFRGIKQADLASYRSAFFQAGLPVETYYAPSESARHFYYESGLPAEMVLWIWIGDHSSELALFDIYGTYQAGTVSSGAENLLADAVRELKLSRAAAQTLTFEVGGRRLNHMHARAFQVLLGKWLAQILQESRHLSNYSQQICEIRPALLLCGKGGTIPHLAEMIASVLELPVRSQRSPLLYTHPIAISDYYQLAPFLGASL